MGKAQLEQYLPDLYRFAMYMLRDHHLAQDVAQETMLKAMGRSKQMDDIQNAKAWLLQVAANLCKDHLRQRKTAVHRPQTLLDEPIGGAPEPWFRMLQRESCESLEKAIEALTERERSVLYLSAFEQLSNPTIADVLEINVGSVKVALSRARKSVRETILRQREKEKPKMNTMEFCEQLDEYLDGDLTPEEVKCFREHAEVCGECRANLDAMAEFDGLVADAKLAFDDWYAVSSDYGKQDAYPTLGDGKQPTSVVSRFLTSVAVVAATIAIVFVARSIANRTRVSPIAREVVRSTNVDSSGEFANDSDNDVNDVAHLKKVNVSMSDDGGYLAEPIESSNPNITIYWLHPTVDAQKVSSNNDSSSIPEQEANLLARKTL